MNNYEKLSASLQPKGEPWECKQYPGSSNGTIIPYASMQSISLASSTGEAPLPVYLGFGSSFRGAQLFQTDTIDLSGINANGKYEVFVMPRDGVVTSVAASIQVAGNVSYFDNTSQLNAQLYTAEGNSTTFNILSGAVAKVTTTSSVPVPADTILSGITENLSIPLKKGTRVLMVVYLQVNPAAATSIVGFASAGVNIV